MTVADDKREKKQPEKATPEKSNVEAFRPLRKLKSDEEAQK